MAAMGRHARRSAVVAALACLAASCAAVGGPAGEADVLRANCHSPREPGEADCVGDGEDRDDPILVRGVIDADPGQPVTICAVFPLGYPPECSRGGLRVEGLDFGRIPKLDTYPDGERATNEDVVLRGTVADGVLRVTEVPPSYAVAVAAELVGLPEPLASAVRVEVWIEGGERFSAAGQDFGIVTSAFPVLERPGFRERRDPLPRFRLQRDALPRKILEGSDGGRLVVQEATCPGDASCIEGLVDVDTSGLRAGTYRFEQRFDYWRRPVDLASDPDAPPLRPDGRATLRVRIEVRPAPS